MTPSSEITSFYWTLTKNNSETLLVESDSFASCLDCLSKLPSVKTVDLSGHSFDQNEFQSLVALLQKNPIIKNLLFSKSLLTTEQLLALQVLTSGQKGLKVLDGEGGKMGPLYMDWHPYNLEKQEAHLRGMRETTKKALEFIQTECGDLPSFVIDFGAGTGQDTIPLLHLGCKKIWCVDGDVEALEILKGNIPGAFLERVTMINAAFVTVTLEAPAALLVASFTWPYRPPKDFPACFAKCIASVAVGGYIAGHFFGPITGKLADPGMTMHTEQEVRELLSHNFEIKFFRSDVEGSGCALFGGDTPAWGALHHVVAKRVV